MSTHRVTITKTKLVMPFSEIIAVYLKIPKNHKHILGAKINLLKLKRIKHAKTSVFLSTNTQNLLTRILTCTKNKSSNKQYIINNVNKVCIYYRSLF
jgi:hypothetical protein